MSVSTEPTNVSGASLSTWFKTGIEKLYNVSEESEFRSQFEDIFADDARIVMNHKPVPVDDFRQELATQRFAVVSETVEWQHVVDSGGQDKNAPEGTVAGCYILTRTFKFLIRAAPAQRKSHVVFSAKVDKQADGGSKVSEFYLTVVDKSVPITLPQIPGNVTTE